jgi:hypothetical protein
MHLGLCFTDGGGTAVLLTSTLIRDYLLNYARPLIYTTSLSNTAIIAASCSFDILEDGTAKKVPVPMCYPTYKAKPHTYFFCEARHARS